MFAGGPVSGNKREQPDMSTEQMLSRITGGRGFIAALDQSGGSTPGALRHYGIPDSAYSGDAQMFRLMHQMRARIMTAPAFTNTKILGAILFEATMDGLVQGKPVPEFLWKERGIVPFLKVDKGLEAASNGVRLMKPIPGLGPLLERARGMGIFGTKMRSVIDANAGDGISELVRQQFDVGAQIAAAGLMPILEPEVSIDISDKASAEMTLRDELKARLDALPAERRVMIKLTIPDVPDFYPQPDRAPASGPGGCALGRLFACAGVREVGGESGIDRQLLACIDRRPQGPVERGTVQP